MKKKMGMRIASFFMSICLTAGLLPLQTEAAPNAAVYSINRNRNGVIAGIREPKADGGSWSGSRVYFGKLGASPLLWRVLDDQVEQITDRKAMLLQTDMIVGSAAFDADTNVWKDSGVRAYLNDTQQFLKGFAGTERDSIVKYDKAAETDTKTDTESGTAVFSNPGLYQDRVFLLSACEATSQAYGYGGAAGRPLVSGNDSSAAGEWWLRSPLKDGSGIQVGVIDGSGRLTGKSTTPETAGGSAPVAGIAPALYLDTAKILFTTPASGGKSDRFAPVEEDSVTSEWKLTMQAVDQSLAAGLNGDSNLFEKGGVIKIKHARASVLQGATQVSALLEDADGNPVYYGRINSNTGAESSEITVPAGLAAGSYKLYVFAEDINGSKQTDYASALGGGIDINISERQTPQITTMPGVTSITYGQSLAGSVFSGGAAKVGSTEIPGVFSWKEPGIIPAVSDSGVTKYEVVFTPADTDRYHTVTLQMTVSILKAANPPTMPDASITVENDITRVKQVKLPEGWSWSAQDAEKELTAGGYTQAAAVYKDTQNYDNSKVTVTISRKSCSHKGGTATCTKLAVCEICKQPYGNVDSGRHGATGVKNAKDATCTEKGYKGDTYCKDCNAIISKGTQTEALGHSYTEKVTKEPTDTEEGIKTFTCSRCGHQYTESMGTHSHYYNGTRTLKYLGCVQQGEIEHYCSCGDSYVDVTPALGHDYKAAVTTKATAERAGVKTYTCSRCGHQYTEAIPKLSGGSGGSGSAGSGSGNSGSGSTIADRMPFVKGNSSVSGWNDINKEIGKAADGDTINISMNDSLLLPKKTLETIKGKNVTLVLDIGNDMKWSILGTDITGESLADMNLKVTKNSNSIPGELVSATAGDLKTLQFSLAHEGEFGGKATLQMLVDSQSAGYYANLFYYNKEGGSLDYVNSSQMDGKGVAGLELTHASDYVVIVDTAVLDGPKEPAPEPTETPETELPEETVPVDAEAPEKDGGISATLIIVIGLIVLGIGLLVIVVLRSRSKQTDFYEE